MGPPGWPRGSVWGPTRPPRSRSVRTISASPCPFTFTRYPVGSRLYVEDLNGGANHVELFSSSTTEEWPAGWHQGKLIVALGVNAQSENPGEYFVWGHGYHIVDSSTGRRIAAVCDGIDSFYPPVPAGTLCTNGDMSETATWDGQQTPLRPTGNCVNVNGPLSPDGTRVAARISVNGNCGVNSVSLVNLKGGVDATPGDRRAPGLGGRHPRGGKERLAGLLDLRYAGAFQHPRPGTRLLRWRASGRALSN